MSALSRNKDQIFWNLINSAIAGSISFFSALLAVGEINARVIFIAFAASALVAIQKFKHFWDGEKDEYVGKSFNFL